MYTTGKWQCREVINLLVEYGVRNIVLCPGTRDTPLIIAAARHPRLNVYSVIDERSAAFIAYGMSKKSGQPVAVVCTSGTAVLNLTPAIAEAYYAHVPLIAVTADRPSEWIDQDDSQTIRQLRLMQDFTVDTVNVSCHCDSPAVRAVISRDINVALTKCTKISMGPIHINVEVDEPISEEIDMPEEEALSCRKINIHLDSSLTEDARERISKRLASEKRIMIVGGFGSAMTKSQKETIDKFTDRDNVVFLAELIGNYSSGNSITMIDEALVRIRKERAMYFPDLVITFGGSLVSRSLKEFIRESGAEHWMIGHHGAYPDCYSALTEVFPKVDGFVEILRDVPKTASDYSLKWAKVKEEVKNLRNQYLPTLPWSDLVAIDSICNHIPKGWNLQLSNGMSVRYALGSAVKNGIEIECNRGVSGIDGSLSTAVGASVASDMNTLLITGDMSAQYDMGAMASNLIDRRLRVVVMINGGGEIFHFIRTTRSLPEVGKYMAATSNFPAEKLAEAFGFRFVKASSREELAVALPVLFGDSDKPVMLAVYTNGVESAKSFHDYYRIIKGNI